MKLYQNIAMMAYEDLEHAEIVGKCLEIRKDIPKPVLLALARRKVLTLKNLESFMKLSAADLLKALA